jgi:hypothetical protein
MYRPRLIVPRSAIHTPDVVRPGSAAFGLETMGVYVPPTPLTPAERVMRELFSGTFLSYRGVFGEAATFDQVKAWIEQIPTEMILGVCSVLSRYATIQSERDLVQRPLVEWAVSPAWAPRVLAMLEGGRNAARQILFHHEQLLLAAKLAILYGVDGPAEPANTGQRYEVGRVLLAASDLLLDARRDVDPESDVILGLVVRGLTLNSVQEARFQIARAYDMFVERGANDPSIGTFFRHKFGIDIADFMAFGLFCATYVRPMLVPRPPWLDLAEIFESGQIVPTRVREHPKWEPTLDLLAAPREWFREQLDDGEVGASTFFPFQQRPYYRSASGAIFPINHRFVLDRIGMGMLWMMHDAQGNKRGTSIQDFMARVGEVCVEPHGIDALRDATPAVSGQRFIAGPENPEYRVTGRGKFKGSDAYIIEGRRLVVFEITGSAVAGKALLSGDGALFRADFKKKMVVEIKASGKRKLGKLGQLDRVIGDLLAGSPVIPGLDINDIDTIYPVLLTLQPMPQYPNIGRVVNAMLSDEGMFQYPKNKVAAVRMINLEELEIIAGDLAAGRIRLADVLQIWIDNPLDHDSSLKNHLIRRNYRELDNTRIHAAYDRWTAKARQTLLDAGLVDVDPQAEPSVPGL